MSEKVNKVLPFFIVLCLIQKLNAQAFLNGSFETNTAAMCDYNMANASWNTKMANSTAYGGGGELDIMQSSCPYGPSQSGTWFAALAFPSTSDAFTMRLSAPLVPGTTYTMSFWDKGDVACCPPGMPVIIGLSTVAGAPGTTIYTGPTPTGGVWSQRCFSFVAPNNGSHVSVSTAGPTRWSHVDNFILNGGCTVLPIELLYLKSACENNMTKLTWATATEKNNKYFGIEYSTNGEDFVQLGTIRGAGNSNSELKYEFLDKQLQKELSYYRLKQVDVDNTITYSNIIHAEKCKSPYDFQFSIFPNPSNTNLTVSANVENVSVVIVDLLGKIIYESDPKSGEISIDVEGFENGIYFVQVISDGKTQTRKFIKN